VKKWREDKTQKYPRLYQWSTVLGGLDFSRSLFLVYFASLGFSGTQTGIFQATLFWTTFALELPTGILADKYGRKRSLSLGMAAMVFTFVILANARSFPVVLIGFVFWGAAFALLSGSGSALLYDGLKESGRLELHLNWLARVRSLGTIALGTSILAGGFLYDFAAPSIFWASAVTASLGFVLIQFVPEPLVHEASLESRPLGTIAALRDFFSDHSGRNLLIFLFGMAAIEMAVTPFFIFSQNLFHEQGVCERNVSFILGGGFFLTSLAQAYSPRARHIPVLVLVATIGLIVAVALGILAMGPRLWVQIVLFGVVNTLPSFLYVHTDQYVQDHCESHIRASLLSVQSFANAVLIGASYLGIGLLSDKIGMAKTLSLLSLPLILGILLVALHFRRAKGKVL